MDKDERNWTEVAIEVCAKATERGVAVLLVRRQDKEGLADIVVTNATTSETAAALMGYNNQCQED